MFDPRMRVRRPQNGGVQRAGLFAEIVDEASAPGQERGVFDALDRLATPGGGYHGHSRTILRQVLCERLLLQALAVPLARMRPGGETTASQDLPKSLISCAAEPATLEPMRDTWRNSLGVTPAWSRKKRVKWPWALKPRSPPTSDRLSSVSITDLTASSMRKQIDVHMRRHLRRALEQPIEMRPRQPGLFGQATDVVDDVRLEADEIDRAADAPIEPLTVAPDLRQGGRQRAPRRETFDDRDHQVGQQPLQRRMVARLRHHQRRKLHGEAADMRRDVAGLPFEESGRAAGGPVRPEALEPLRLDIEREDDRARARRVVDVGMGFPGIDQHRLSIGQRHHVGADRELRVVAVDLEEDVAMRMGMAHKRAVHVEQGDTAERAMSDAQCV